MTVDPFIEEEEVTGHSVKRCRELLEISRAAYYERRTGAPSRRQHDDTELMEKIVGHSHGIEGHLRQPAARGPLPADAPRALTSCAQFILSDTSGRVGSWRATSTRTETAGGRRRPMDDAGHGPIVSNWPGIWSTWFVNRPVERNAGGGFVGISDNHQVVKLNEALVAVCTE